ncbi:Fic family protein [Antrihabitans sp. YC3-6]|uniref:Fic family protein n=1 Tax=Antrihabitans stalagmiti TaxID=2799499 RepID=A0A934NTI7_9NOCA|nr:Fic family protein [Antrihabitans stalagmiti]MBJ8341035.1 Fic family protein [Antrihabitans stalagmiti]
MKVPAPPPNWRELSAEMQRTPERLISLVKVAYETSDDYAPWDKVRYRKAPDGLTAEDWWFALRLKRLSAARTLPLRDVEGAPFTYALPDEVLRLCDEIGSRASGFIAAPEPVTNPATRDRYLVNSLIEEAITSSQLEGAATTRSVAKDMLRTGRSPRNRSELMIANNYRAMRRVVELRESDFTPEAILELHRIVTDGTLDSPDAAGRMQSNPDPADRVSVLGDDDQVLHRPPPVSELPRRLIELCRFANGQATAGWMHPVLRALTIHFMAGYDHYFEDGNGRTARALFYWSMLKQGYWLTEFLTVSTILKKAPGQYARSFLYSEQDGGDLTYFFIYHLNVIKRALDDLDVYLAAKVSELRRTRSLLSDASGFNHRQIALLELAVKDPDATFTAQSHADSHGISGERARQDLMALEARGLLSRTKNGRKFVWIPAADIATRLAQT